MFQQLAFGLLCVAGALFLAAGEPIIRHLVLDNGAAHMTSTSGRNFAITDPSLLESYGWKTLSVNNDSIVTISPSCQVAIKTSFNEQERASVAASNASFEQLYNIGDYQGDVGNGRQRYIFEADKLLVDDFSWRMSQSFHMLNTKEGLSLTKRNDTNSAPLSYSVRRDQPADEWARIFVDGDIVAFVRRDGSVQMKPADCLQPAEKQLLSEIRGQMDRAFAENSQQTGNNRMYWLRVYKVETIDLTKHKKQPEKRPASD